jgi:ankyrin repeat protein
MFMAPFGLARACKKGNGAVVFVLANHEGVDLDQTCSFGFTALQLAAVGDFAEVALILVEKGTDINRANAYGNTALHCAAERGFLDLAKLLVQKGANLGAKNKQGKTAVDLARHNGHKGFSCLAALQPAASSATQSSNLRVDQYQAASPLQAEGADDSWLFAAEGP